MNCSFFSYRYVDPGDPLDPDHEKLTQGVYLLCRRRPFRGRKARPIR